MKVGIHLLFMVIMLVSAFKQAACQQNKSNESLKSTKIEKGMTKVSVLYPAGEGKNFDWNYYFSKHIPMLKNLLKDSVKVITVDKGISGRTPGSPAPYMAMFHMYFETITAYQNLLGPNAEKIRGDIPNYTNIQPIVQISEVQE
jgi:uncharacterized protein (TIGR02118 family)